MLLELHAPLNPLILDVTANRGVMWRGTPYRPVRMDIEPAVEPDVVGDFRDIPFPAESFDVLAFDPPHLPAHAASRNSSGIERMRYGITADGDYRQGDNISPAFADFAAEAERVLRPNGIVIAKLTDLVHNHRYQWQHVAFIEAVVVAGLTPCDLIVKVEATSANLASSKWQTVHHFRRAHTYWIVVRKGRCERARLTPTSEKAER